MLPAAEPTDPHARARRTRGASMSDLRILMRGIVFGESPRWHEGRLWFCNWGAREIVAVDVDGNREVIAPGPKMGGYCIDWLPDGRLLVTGERELLRLEPDGSLVTHTDLSALPPSANEIVVDGRGNVYVNVLGFAFGQEDFRPG